MNLERMRLSHLIFIGPAIGTLLFYLFMDWRYKATTNDITTEQVNQYMQNSQSYPMIFDTFIHKKSRYEKAHYKQSKSLHQYIFYNKYMNKYFSFYGIELAVLEDDFVQLKNIPFQGKVNNDEINSGKGNSADNPILVWDIDIDSTHIDEGNRKGSSMYNKNLNRKKRRTEKGTDAHLYFYFKLFVPKEEFEKIFPKKE